MYIKQIRKGNKPLYYILVVKDSRKDTWVEHFISSDMAKVLVEDFDVKVKEMQMKGE